MRRLLLPGTARTPLPSPSQASVTQTPAARPCHPLHLLLSPEPGPGATQESPELFSHVLTPPPRGGPGDLSPAPCSCPPGPSHPPPPGLCPLSLSFLLSFWVPEDRKPSTGGEWVRRKLRCSGPPCRARSIPALTAGMGRQRRHGAWKRHKHCHCGPSSMVNPSAQNTCTQITPEKHHRSAENGVQGSVHSPGVDRDTMGTAESGRGSPPPSPARTPWPQDTLQQSPQFSPWPRFSSRSRPGRGPGSALTMAAASGTSVSGQRMANPARGWRNFARAVQRGDAPPSNATLRPGNGGGASETGGVGDGTGRGHRGETGGHRGDWAGRKRLEAV